MLGKLLGQGRKSKVYEWDDASVIKLFFPHVDTQSVSDEYHSSLLASKLGLPCPRVLDRVTVDGQEGIVFERVNGMPLLGAALSGLCEPTQVSQGFAKTQVAINQTKVEDLPEYRDLLLQLLMDSPKHWFSKTQKQKLEGYLQQLPSGNFLCHMDYHPDNVLVEDNELKVIDWASAVKGPSEFDFAYTLLVLSLGELPPGLAEEQQQFLMSMRQQFFELYVETYTQDSGISPAGAEAFSLACALFRLLYWRIDGEEEQLKTTIYQYLQKTS